MDHDKKSGFGEKVETALTWAAILYLLAWAVDWLIQRRWGMFLVLWLAGSIASFLAMAFSVTAFLDLTGDIARCLNDAVIVGELVAAGIIGIILAACSTPRIYPQSKTRRTRMRRKKTA